MPAFFALHDWSPRLFQRMRKFLHTLFERNGAINIEVNIWSPSSRTRTLKRKSALIHAEIGLQKFSLEAFADPVDEWLDNSNIKGGLHFLSAHRVLHFACQYMTTRELALAVKSSDILDHISTAYGYIGDSSHVIGPPVCYILGTPWFPAGTPVSEILAEKHPVQDWNEVLYFADKPYLDGKFRDLYPENLVGRKHVQRLRKHGLLRDSVSGISVERIGADLFWITVAEDQLKRTRDLLSAHELLLVTNSYPMVKLTAPPANGG